MDGLRLWNREWPEEFRKLAGDINQLSAPLYILQNTSCGENETGSAILSTKGELDGLTGLTGGSVMTNAGMEEAIAKARTDLRESYSIEYVEPEQERQDDYHSVRVVCKRVGISLRYPRIYFAPHQ